MTEYKVGDKVNVRSDLVIGRRYGSNTFVTPMEKYLGETIEITNLIGNEYGIADCLYSFTNEMIAGFSEPQQFLRMTDKAVAGKKYLVLNDEDIDFPVGTVVTAISFDHFSGSLDGTTYMLDRVLLQEIPEDNSEPEELTFTQLIEKLPELVVGTEFKSSYGSILYVGHQREGMVTSNKHFYWKNSDEVVGVTEVSARATYKAVTPEPVKPEYTEITWQEALQIIADGGEVFLDSEKYKVNKTTDFEDIDDAVGFEDFSEFFITDWYKKTE